MRVVVLYRPNSEHAGEIESYVKEYGRFQPDHNLELLSLDTPEGADMAALYAINEYPAILALANDGSLLRLWSGERRPLMSELAGYGGQ